MVLMDLTKRGQKETLKKAFTGIAFLTLVVILFANFGYSLDYNNLKYINHYNYKDIPKFTIPQKTIDAIQSVWDYTVAFNENYDVLSYKDDFSLDLTQYIHNKYNSTKFKLKITAYPEYLTCNLANTTLNCEFKKKYIGKDYIIIQLTDTSWKYPYISSLKLEFNLTTQNIVAYFQTRRNNNYL